MYKTALIVCMCQASEKWHMIFCARVSSLLRLYLSKVYFNIHLQKLHFTIREMSNTL